MDFQGGAVRERTRCVGRTRSQEEEKAGGEDTPVTSHTEGVDNESLDRREGRRDGVTGGRTRERKGTQRRNGDITKRPYIN